ncbi:pilus assembly PilX family protein [Desulfonatronovibrio magnus]|uniref:pilus assembly PilX family protein n=1 Tax=Desulfonatronovibrio magnus TaxID=698827 RepID=UPI0005EB3CDA|nr:PilX N-terminal domain-containing pilus assembly protein [Desulfonatronovibrio magnus]
MNKFDINLSVSEKNSECGTVLVIGIIILMVLTLLSVVSMRVTTLEERMASGLRDRDLAFQAAEAALREGESLLEVVSLPEFDNSNGLFQPDPELWQIDNAVWNTDARIFTTSLQGLSAKPHYIIEELPPVPGETDSLAADEPIPDTGMYRITAKASGGRKSTVIILQTTYKR